MTLGILSQFRHNNRLSSPACFLPSHFLAVGSALLHTDVGPFLGALGAEWGAVSPGAVAEGPPFSPSSTPRCSFQSLGNGKLIQLLGAEQCGCAAKSSYFWILPPPCPTQAPQLSAERCFPRNITRHGVGLWHVINTEQPKCAAGTAFQVVLWDPSRKGNSPPDLIAKGFG